MNIKKIFAPKIKFTKELVREIVRRELTELCKDEKYTVSFLFDMDSRVLEGGIPVGVQLMAKNNIVFYIDAIFNEIIRINGGKYSVYMNDALYNEAKKLIRTLASNQLFNLSNPANISSNIN